jgi:hypothetical protein
MKMNFFVKVASRSQFVPVHTVQSVRYGTVRSRYGTSCTVLMDSLREGVNPSVSRRNNPVVNKRKQLIDVAFLPLKPKHMMNDDDGKGR